jgi:hypothetical protein
MNTSEKFNIYIETKNNNQVNDKTPFQITYYLTRLYVVT